MALYELLENEEKLEQINRTSFVGEKIKERADLQQYLLKDISILADDLLVITEEYSEWEDSKRRIDILALDKEANLVVIELKRDEKGGHMELQAIRYAAMVSEMTWSKLIEVNAAFRNCERNEAEEAILLHLENVGDSDEDIKSAFPGNIRILLVSEDFSSEVTSTVLWLNKNDNIDITCIRLVPYKKGESLLIDVQQIIPLPEAQDFMVRQKEKGKEARQFKTNKDFSKYLFEGIEYGKGPLVLNVIHKMIADGKFQNLEQLQKEISKTIQGSREIALTFEEAKEIFQRENRWRNFRKEEQLLKFPDGSIAAVTSQWGKGNIDRFIDKSIQLGYEIKTI